MNRAPKRPAGRPAGLEDPRGLALGVIEEVLHGSAHSREALDAAFSRAKLEARDRALATELVYGGLRHMRSLHVLTSSLAKGGSIDGKLRGVLRLAAFQMVYLDRVPAHAAVNAAVEQAKRIGGDKAAGFANGLLRGLGRALLRKGGLDEFAKEDPRRLLPLGRGRAALFEQAFLPDPAEELDLHLSAAWSCPSWLIARWRKQHGDAKTLRILEAAADTPTLDLRPNPLRTDAASLAARLAESGIEAQEPGQGALAVRGAGDLALLEAFREGWFSVQDRSSQSVLAALDPRPGERVLDLCSAPGTKAAAAAERMKNQGLVLAVDRDAARLSRMGPDLARLGIHCVRPMVADATKPFLFREERTPAFDKVLLDAPCSNTGVLRRRPEVRWRLELKDIVTLAKTQDRLLVTAAMNCRSGGVLVYSTCSIEPEENQDRVRAFLQGIRGFELLEERLAVPEPGAGDGGYWAKLRRQ